ncbi:MAG: hypothetical protein JXB29_11210 [Sedimentisphaerales bacterium]|nr:hypothetical protein [Sedimentisphaerales bacterium]
MKAKKFNMIMLGILLAMGLVLVLTGCKKKVQSANAASSEESSQGQESVQLDQFDESFNYLQSEDEEPAEDPNEYPEDEPNEEPDDEPDEPDEEEPGDDEPEYPDEQPDEDPNAPEEEPNDSPEEDPNESWL